MGEDRPVQQYSYVQLLLYVQYVRVRMLIPIPDSWHLGSMLLVDTIDKSRACASNVENVGQYDSGNVEASQERPSRQGDSPQDDECISPRFNNQQQVASVQTSWSTLHVSKEPTCMQSKKILQREDECLCHNSENINFNSKSSATHTVVAIQKKKKQRQIANREKHQTKALRDRRRENVNNIKTPAPTSQITTFKIVSTRWHLHQQRRCLIPWLLPTL